MKSMKTLRRMMTKVQHLMNMIRYSKLYFKITVFDNHSKSASFIVQKLIGRFGTSKQMAKRRWHRRIQSRFSGSLQSCKLIEYQGLLFVDCRFQSYFSGSFTKVRKSSFQGLWYSWVPWRSWGRQQQRKRRNQRPSAPPSNDPNQRRSETWSH